MGTENATSVWFNKNNIKPESGDILDSCRLCMVQNKNMKDLFVADQKTIIEKVEFCTGLQLRPEEGLPSHICDACLHNLNLYYTFKTMCLTSDERFRQLAPKIKIENSELDNHFDNFDDENDCKDILKEVLKLSDIKISRIKLKKESNRSSCKLSQKKRQAKLNTTKSQLHKNKKSISQKQKVSYDCDLCSISFKTKEQSAEHKKAVHKETESFVCEICGKVMQYRASLYTHMQSHLPPRHACDKCDYKTGHKHDLVKHRRIHSGIKLFQCEFCTASYHTSSNLRSHIRLNHEGAPKRFPCRLCDRSFFDRTKLRRHIDAHNDIKRYECEVCHSCFARRCYWKKHMLRQHGVAIPPARPGRQKVNLLLETTTQAPASGNRTVINIIEPPLTSPSRLSSHPDERMLSAAEYSA